MYQFSFCVCLCLYVNKERTKLLYLYLNTDIPEDTERQNVTLSHHRFKRDFGFKQKLKQTFIPIHTGTEIYVHVSLPTNIYDVLRRY